MNCSICGSSLFPGRAVFRCYCGAYTHGYCWEKHVLEAHKPPFVVGTINRDDEFTPKKAETRQGPHPTEGTVREGQ